MDFEQCIFIVKNIQTDRQKNIQTRVHIVNLTEGTILQNISRELQDTQLSKVLI